MLLLAGVSTFFPDVAAPLLPLLLSYFDPAFAAYAAAAAAAVVVVVAAAVVVSFCSYF